MKKVLPLLIVLLLTVGLVTFYFMKKKKTAVATPEGATAIETESQEDTSVTKSGLQTSAVPARLQTVSAMNAYIDQIYKKGTIPSSVDSTWDSNVASYNVKAKDWASSMYKWCYEKQNGWSFESQAAKAEANGYSLPLQMVQSIAWQLCEQGSAKIYSTAVWHEIERMIFNIAVKEQ